jgi:hypothetical protein
MKNATGSSSQKTGRISPRSEALLEGCCVLEDKVVPVCTMETYQRSPGKAIFSLHLCTRSRWVVTLTPGEGYPGREHTVSIKWTGWAPEPNWTFRTKENLLSLLESDTCIFHPLPYSVLAYTVSTYTLSELKKNVIMIITMCNLMWSLQLYHYM